MHNGPKSPLTLPVFPTESFQSGNTGPAKPERPKSGDWEAQMAFHDAQRAKSDEMWEKRQRGEVSELDYNLHLELCRKAMSEY